MSYPLDRFERVARSIDAVEVASAAEATEKGVVEAITEPHEAHPFESRNIHPDLPPRVRRLFDDGHWEESVFKAFKFIESEVKRLSGLTKTGFALMMDAFNEDNPKVRLNALSSESEVDEQKGYKFMFAGAAAGIRNPRGHEVEVGDTPDEALDYLALASLLLRRLDMARVR